MFLNLLYPINMWKSYPLCKFNGFKIYWSDGSSLMLPPIPPVVLLVLRTCLSFQSGFYWIAHNSVDCCQCLEDRSGTTTLNISKPVMFREVRCTLRQRLILSICYNCFREGSEWFLLLTQSGEVSCGFLISPWAIRHLRFKKLWRQGTKRFAFIGYVFFIKQTRQVGYIVVIVFNVGWNGWAAQSFHESKWSDRVRFPGTGDKTRQKTARS